jgi:dienelactone hydrolase
MRTLTWRAGGNTERRSAGLALVLALGWLVFLTDPASGQFPGTGAQEKNSGSFRLDPKDRRTIINYWQFEPRKAKGPLPAILVFHGIEGLDGFVNKGGMAKELEAYKLLCKMIAEKGYVVRFVHYMECRPVLAKEVAALKMQIKTGLVAPPVNRRIEALFKDWMACVKHAMDDLRDRNNPRNSNVDPNRVGVVGMSLGGFVVMSLAVTDAKFDPQALVVVCGGLPEKLQAQVTKLPPVLMLCCTRDEIVPMKQLYKVRNCLEDKDCSVTLLPFACFHMFMNGPMGAKPAPGPDLEMILEAVDYAAVFLEKKFRKALKAAK